MNKNQQKWNANALTRTAIVAALYVVLTLAFSFMSYGNIQFRISEVMTILAFFNPFYIWGLTIGCLVANLLSPVGLPDIIFGTLATFISVSAMAITGRMLRYSKMGIWVASLWPALFNGLIIGAMLFFVFELPFALPLLMVQVAFGELVVVTIVGVPLTLLLTSKYPKAFHFLQEAPVQ